MLQQLPHSDEWVSYLNKVTEVIDERQIPCIFGCDLVLTGKLQAIVKKRPNLSDIQALHILMLGTPAEAQS